MDNKLRLVLRLFLISAAITIGFGNCNAAELKNQTAYEPRIGLLYTEDEARKLPKTDELEAYTKALQANGGRIVALSQLLSPAKTTEQLNSIDALLLPGGDDVNPALYGQKPHPKLEAIDSKFDHYEIAAIKKAQARGIPILGICKGHQLLNVYFGGELYQDLPSQLHSSVTVVHRKKENGETVACYHDISISTSSVLYGIFGAARLNVNSYHHQGVSKPGSGLKTTAFSDDGLIEATEGKNILTIQFHPEEEREKTPIFNKVFAYFTEQARRRHDSR